MTRYYEGSDGIPQAALMRTRPDSPDPTGPLVDFEPLDEWPGDHAEAMKDPEYAEAYERASRELEYAYTEVCLLGNCTTDWYQGRNLGGIGLVWAPGMPSGCRHRESSRRLRGGYRRRLLARKRRAR